MEGLNIDISVGRPEVAEQQSIPKRRDEAAEQDCRQLIEEVTATRALEILQKSDLNLVLQEMSIDR